MAKKTAIEKDVATTILKTVSSKEEAFHCLDENLKGTYTKTPNTNKQKHSPNKQKLTSGKWNMEKQMWDSDQNHAEREGESNWQH